MFKLNQDGTFAVKRGTGEWHNTESSPEYRAWLAEGNTPEPADPLPVPDNKSLRAEAYRLESDPLFFQEQRKSVPEGTWLAKIAEIKARYP